MSLYPIVEHVLHVVHVCIYDISCTNPCIHSFTISRRHKHPRSSSISPLPTWWLLLLVSRLVWLIWLIPTFSLMAHLLVKIYDTYISRWIIVNLHLYSVLMLFGLSTHATSVRPGKAFGKEIISGEDQRWYNGSEIWYWCLFRLGCHYFYRQWRGNHFIIEEHCSCSFHYRVGYHW